MSLTKAMIISIVKSITNFLPLGTSGHISLLKHFFRVNDVLPIDNILLHLVYVLIICTFFFKDIRKLIVESVLMIFDLLCNIFNFIRRISGYRPRYKRVVCTSYRRFACMVLMSTIPTAIISIAARELVVMIDKNVLITASCLIITATILVLTDKLHSKGITPKDATYTQAFIIGICQGIAVIPGISRLAITIFACILLGYELKFAVKYSFIISIPAILGLTLVTLITDTQRAFTLLTGEYILCAVVVFIIGLVCIKVVLTLVEKKKCKYLGLYCYICSIASIIGYFIVFE